MADVHRENTMHSELSCTLADDTPPLIASENINKRRRNTLKSMNTLQKSLSIGDIINMNTCCGIENNVSIDFVCKDE